MYAPTLHSQDQSMNFPCPTSSPTLGICRLGISIKFSNLMDMKIISLWFLLTLRGSWRKVNYLLKVYQPFMVHLLWITCSYFCLLIYLLVFFLLFSGSSLNNATYPFYQLHILQISYYEFHLSCLCCTKLLEESKVSVFSLWHVVVMPCLKKLSLSKSQKIFLYIFL